MSRRISKEALVDALDADIAWRRLELAAIRTTLKRSTGPSEATAARAAVALAYAHWEGYVVATSRSLLQYVTGLRLRYEDLTDSYVAMCLAGRLTEAEASTRRIRRHIDVVAVLRSSEDRADFPLAERVIHAEGNLKSEKFDDIIARLGLDRKPFELHYNWLDGELLRKRNHIAHGEIGYVDTDFAYAAIDTVAGLIDNFRTAAQNAAVLEVFRRP